MVDSSVFVHSFVFLVCLHDPSTSESFWSMVSCWKWVLSGTPSDSYNLFINSCTTSSLLRSMTSGEGAFGLTLTFSVLDLVVFALFSELSLCVEVPNGTDTRLVNFFWLLESFPDLVTSSAASSPLLTAATESFTSELSMMYGSELTRILRFDGLFGIKRLPYDVDWFKTSFSPMHGSKPLDFSFLSPLCELYLEAIRSYRKKFFG